MVAPYSRYSPTVGEMEGGVSYERCTPVVLVQCSVISAAKADFSVLEPSTFANKVTDFVVFCRWVIIKPVILYQNRQNFDILYFSMIDSRLVGPLWEG